MTPTRFCCLGILLTLVVANALGATPPESATAAPPPLSLKIVPLVDGGPEFAVRFTATNVSSEPQWPIDLGVADNSVLVMFPDGSYEEDLAYADPGPQAQLVDPSAPDRRFLPGRSQDIDRSIRHIGGNHEMWDVPGEFRIFWNCRGARSNELLLVRRSEGNKEAVASAEKGTRGPNAAVVDFCKELDSRMGRFLAKDLPPALARDVANEVEGRGIDAARFREALKLQFGPKADDGFEIEASVAAIDAISRAKFAIPPYFEECTVQLDRPIKLVRGEHNDWWVAGKNFVEAGAVAPRLKVSREIFEEMIEQVKSGKFRSAAEAKNHLRERIVAADAFLILNPRRAALKVSRANP